MTKCPICGKDIGVYYWPSALDWMVIDVFDMELYQRSYPDESEYISPRCEQCFDKAVGHKVPCPICGKPYKGKIGVGVHLKRSHTSEERSRLYLKQVMAVMPTIMTVVTIVAVARHIEQEQGIPKEVSQCHPN